MLSVQTSRHIEKEMLSVQTYVNNTWDTESEHFPQSLPKLKLLACEYPNNSKIAVTGKLLTAAAHSLQHLVLSCNSNFENFSYPYVFPMGLVKMEKLTHIVFDHVSELSFDVMMHSRDTLEFMAVGMEHNYYANLKLHFKLAALKEIVLAFEHEEFVECQNHRFISVEHSYPTVRVKGIEVSGYCCFANGYMKKLKADKCLNIECHCW
eukprot:TRINITY_DN12665_c0_g1_i1.p1 TRINITY_DN12665_c0_g1~~TRINITY_DN12665_c0_g1_i1.p1  ORF type:complete len:244 (-),score=41.10 TRINITY_DN12665_c0_g1_i1:240-863(-)